MNQTSNINPKDIQHYLKNIKKQLLLTHSQAESNSIIEMLQTSIYEFIDANPAATMNDLKMHLATMILSMILNYIIRIPKHLKKN